MLIIDMGKHFLYMNFMINKYKREQQNCGTFLYIRPNKQQFITDAD